MCKGITFSDEPTENYYVTLQFLSALQSLIVIYSSLFWVFLLQLYCVGSVSSLSSEYSSGGHKHDTE